MATQAFKFSELGITAKSKTLLGDKLKIERIFGREINVEAFVIKPSTLPEAKAGDMCLHMQFTLNGNRHVVFTGSEKLQTMILQVPDDKFPFTTTIIKQEDGSFLFT